MMGGSDKKSFVLYHDIRTPLELLSDSDRGKLFLAILDYSEFGAVPDFSGALQMAFAFIQTALDRDAQTWEEKRAARVEAGRRGGLAKASNASVANQCLAKLAVPVPVPVPDNVPVPVPEKRERADKPPAPARFVPPSVKQVQDYCNVKQYKSVDAETFVGYYSARGWTIGKSPMVDWRAALDVWARREKTEAKKDELPWLSGGGGYPDGYWD